MTIESCQRCGTQSAKLVVCDYCNRNIGNECIKSQKRKKIGHRIICRSCWSSISKRSMFKSAN